jgi:hypothetical protein
MALAHFEACACQAPIVTPKLGSMRNCDHPAYQSTERKLRRFAGVLYSFSELLRQDGFDRDEAGRWWAQETRKLEALELASRNDPARVAECRSQRRRLETELLRRMDQLIRFLSTHAPEDPRLPLYRVYMARWHDCYGEPLRPLRSDDLASRQESEALVVAPTIYGVAYERLEAARLWLCKMELSHKDLAALALFLCGFSYADGYLERHGEPPQHGFKDGLREVVREALEEAVDYANLPATEAQVQCSKRKGTPAPIGRLIMTMCHAQRHHTPAVYEWLHRAAFIRDLTSLLFAMGVRARTSIYAKGFVAKWGGDPSVALAVLPGECGELLDGFRHED